MNNPRRYEDDFHNKQSEIRSIKNTKNVNQLHILEKRDPSRAKFLRKLITSGVLELGGRRTTKKMNKNKKKHKLRRRHSKKN